MTTVNVSRELAVAECQTCDWRGTHPEPVGEEWGCPACIKKYGESGEVVWQEYIPADDFKALASAEQPSEGDEAVRLRGFRDRLSFAMRKHGLLKDASLEVLLADMDEAITGVRRPMIEPLTTHNAQEKGNG